MPGGGFLPGLPSSQLPNLSQQANHTTETISFLRQSGAQLQNISTGIIDRLLSHRRQLSESLLALSFPNHAISQPALGTTAQGQPPVSGLECTEEPIFGVEPPL